MNKTINYELLKPGYEDNADIMDLNSNWDSIDSIIKHNDDRAISSEHNLQNDINSRLKISDLSTLDNIVSDIAIGNRSIDDPTLLTGSFTGILTSLFNRITSSIRSIRNNTVNISNSNGGFSAGLNSFTAYGVSIGINSKTYDDSISNGSIAIGNNSESDSGGGAIGYYTYSNGGGAIGSRANVDGGGGAIGFSSNSFGGGGAIGAQSYSESGGAIGYYSSAQDGFSGGFQAKSLGTSVQLGTGINNISGTLQFRNYQLLDANGNIPMERMTYAIGNVLGGSF